MGGSQQLIDLQLCREPSMLGVQVRASDLPLNRHAELGRRAGNRRRPPDRARQAGRRTRAGALRHKGPTLPRGGAGGPPRPRLFGCLERLPTPPARAASARAAPDRSESGLRPERRAEQGGQNRKENRLHRPNHAGPGLTHADRRAAPRAGPTWGAIESFGPHPHHLESVPGDQTPLVAVTRFVPGILTPFSASAGNALLLTADSG
jgi:hypothetical protein